MPRCLGNRQRRMPLLQPCVGNAVTIPAMTRALRIVLLLFALATVAQWAWIERQRVTEWAHPLRVVAYPVDADDTEAARSYLAGVETGRHNIGIAKVVRIAAALEISPAMFFTEPGAKKRGR